MIKSKMIILGTTIFHIYSCTKPIRDSDNSQLNGGNLRTEVYKDQWLVNVAPDQHISVCDVAKVTLSTSITTWAKSIGRSARLKIDSECDTNADVVVRGRKALASEESCLNGAAAFAEINKRQISYCPPFGDDEFSYAMKGITIHEVGHLWGLCDQYSHGILDADNCDPNHESKNGDGSKKLVGTAVMGSSDLIELTPDDIEWIGHAAQRADIPANALWNSSSQPNNSRLKPFGVTVLDSSETRGVVISAVTKTSLAATNVMATIDGRLVRGGLSVGDIISSINGVRIYSESDFGIQFDLNTIPRLHFEFLDSANGYKKFEAYVDRL